MGPRNSLPTTLLTIAITIVGCWLFFSWIEAGTEVRVLCGNFYEGLDEATVVRTLETGSYLRYSEVTSADGRKLVVDSLWNLGRTTCEIHLSSNGIVTRVIDA